MRMGTTVQEETDALAWDRYVAAHPQATQYHRWLWRRVVEQSFGHRTYYLSARQTGQVVGLLPLVLMRSRLFGRFLVSLPFFNYGGLLCDRPEVETDLLRAAEEIGRSAHVGFIEFRHSEKKACLARTKEHKVTMLLDLKSHPKSQWEALGAKVRNQIRKAEKSNLAATVGGPELLDDFYHVFSVNMRDLGTPVYSKQFFATMAAHVGDAFRAVVVRHHEHPVAAAFLLRFRDRLEIPWASSVRQYNAFCPNNLLYWEALQWAVRHGVKWFDFGRSTPGSGTYRFKEQWGARPVQLYWQYSLPDGSRLPHLSPENRKYRLAAGLWRRLPIRLTRWLGPRVVKYLP